ncbi:MAG: porin family protein [Alphaproteobacteria bacterium]|nr:porin family protein [Alphaproteobacteria bacterium]
MRLWGVVLAGVLMLLAELAGAADLPGAGPRGRFDYLTIRQSGGYAEFKNLENIGSRPGAIQKDNTNDLTAASGIAIGLDWRKYNVPVRTELEYFHDYRFDYNSQLLQTLPGTGSENNIEADTVLVNAYYDIRLTDKWVPYIGGGIGFSSVRSDSNFANFATGQTESKVGSREGFTWALALGLNYFFSERWSAQIGYRYTNLPGLTIGQFLDGTKVGTDHFDKHELVLGVSWWF